MSAPQHGRAGRPTPGGTVVSVIIPTYNRAGLLGETLDALAATNPTLPGRWEVVVVDNNSSDATSEIVRARQESFPVPLRYVFEAQQGRSCALNAGLEATTSPVIAFIDDDVVVAGSWLEAGTAPLLDPTRHVEYTGGPVTPIWQSPCPPWLSERTSDLWGTIAILDYGPEAFVFEERQRVPLGANMAARRTLFDRIGTFSTRFGRSGQRKLLGQEVPELLARSRAAGLRGQYVPAMIVRHHVPTQRLSKEYFRRWWFGKGMSRAQLDRVHPVTELGLDLRRVRSAAGLPLFMLRSAISDVGGWLLAAVTFNRQERTRCEMMLCYFAGYVTNRRRESRKLQPVVAN
jgi:glycosyltransferase involved in cell wall biosynthesis